MNLTEEQLKEVETMAGLGFSVYEIAVVLELDEITTEDLVAKLIAGSDDLFVKTYARGRLSAQVQLRTAIKQAALNGSNPAQGQMIEFFNKSKL